MRFSFNEKYSGTINSFFEVDRKDAHHEKVLLLRIASFEDLIRLKSFLMEYEFNICIFKLVKHFFISFRISFPYIGSSVINLKELYPFEIA